MERALFDSRDTCAMLPKNTSVQKQLPPKTHNDLKKDGVQYYCLITDEIQLPKKKMNQSYVCVNEPKLRLHVCKVFGVQLCKNKAHMLLSCI